MKPMRWMARLAMVCLLLTAISPVSCRSGSNNNRDAGPDGSDADGGQDGGYPDGGDDGGRDGGYPDGGDDGSVLACPSGPMLDLAVAVAASDQSIPKVAPTGTGNTWVSWYANDGDLNFDMRLQLLDPDGQPLLDAEGLLVSDHATNTWVTDYSMIADGQGGVILAFNDVRSGNSDVFAYRISPAGEFLWGADGVALSTSAQSDIFPKIALLDDGDVVFTWERDNDQDGVYQIEVQRLSAAGAPMWGDGVTIEPMAGGIVTRPWIVRAGGESVIVVWIDAPDPVSYDRTIFARKLNGRGQQVWAQDAVISDTHEIPFAYDPILISDEAGGAFVAWTTSDDGIHSRIYLQHLAGDGGLTMPAGGVPVSTSQTSNQYNPLLLFVSGSQEVLAVWRETDPGREGISAQRFTLDGTPGWADTGQVIEPLSASKVQLAGLAASPGGATIVYRDWSFGNDSDCRILAGDLVLALQPDWTPAPLADFQSGKDNVVVSLEPACGLWVAWEDHRQDAGEIRVSYRPLP